MLYKECCIKDEYATTRKTQTQLVTTVMVGRKIHRKGDATRGTVIPAWQLE